MAERDRFVSRRVDEIISALCDHPWRNAPDGPDRFPVFSRLVAALCHYEFHGREQSMLDAWERVGEDERAAEAVTAELTGLLDGADYEPLTTAELAEAMKRESLIPLRLEVDLDDYEEVLIYRRGTHRRAVEIPRWRGLRTEHRFLTVDERVVVHTRVKPLAWFETQGIDPADRNLVPGHVSIKQFQDVPRGDIEMLLPSARARLRTVDSLVLAVPAVASGVAVLATKLLPTLGLLGLLVGAWLGLRDEEPVLDQGALVALLGGVVAFGAFTFRQVSKFRNRHVQHLKTLSENLYLRTLADGPGVLHTLLSAAEEHEVIDALLAYRFLVDSPPGLRTDELDRAVGTWLVTGCCREVDFDVVQATEKLLRLGVVEGGNRVRARPLHEALSLLHIRWDDTFRLDHLG